MQENLEPSRQAGDDGIFIHFRRLTGNFFQHIQALGNLAGLEGRETARRGLYILIAVCALLFFLAFGYLLFFLFLAFLISSAFGLGWHWIALIFALLHFGLAGGAYFILRKQFGEPFFPTTSAELRRDFDLLSKGDS